MSMGIVAGVVGVASAVSSYSNGRKANKAAAQNVDAQYKYDLENYRIQQDYRRELVGFKRQQERFAAKQKDFAYEQRAYAEEQYAVSLANIAKEQAFREKEVYNLKMAAKTEHIATGDVAVLMQLGAESSMQNAIAETERTGTANIRDVGRQTQEALGEVNAANSGIAGGRSKNRALIDVYMQKNRAEAQLSDKAKANIIAASAAKDEMLSNYSLKVAESYRKLTAVLETQAQPASQIAGPQPIFTEVAPIGPVSPVGAAPIKGVATSNSFSTLASAVNTGVNTYSWTNNLFGSSSGATSGATGGDWISKF